MVIPGQPTSMSQLHTDATLLSSASSLGAEEQPAGFTSTMCTSLCWSPGIAFA